MGFKNFIEKLFKINNISSFMVKSGIYHYSKEIDGAIVRFHLRVDLDGSGLLLVNSTIGARLSLSGVIIAKALFEGDDIENIIKKISSVFISAPPENIKRDIENVKRIIDNYAAPGDNYPIINLDDASFSPYESKLMSPLSADICPGNEETALKITDKLWENGIGHIKILLGENFDSDAMNHIIEHAEDLGMITGLLAKASDLTDEDYIKKIASSGIDYISLFFASSEKEEHDRIFGNGDYDLFFSVIKNIKQNEICLSAAIPLIEMTIDNIFATMEKMVSTGFKNFTFYSIAAPDDFPEEKLSGAFKSSAMLQVAATIEETAANFNMRFLWTPPVLRDASISIEEQIRKGPRCSGDVSVRIDPDGNVIPARGLYKSAGNILNDPWEKIWGNEVFKIYRERVESPTRCPKCPGLSICAADCPENPEGWAR